MPRPHFFPERLTRKVYLKCLRKELHQYIENIPLNLYANFRFQQDGAPPHNTRQEFLGNNYVNQWTGVVALFTGHPDHLIFRPSIASSLKDRVYSGGTPRKLRKAACQHRSERHSMCK
uniref:Uncharacterized protein n=1 Tax=Photinus pyralis TaxID=7054 RepID=A0A1Y1MXG7_PHOPY